MAKIYFHLTQTTSSQNTMRHGKENHIIIVNARSSIVILNLNDFRHPSIATAYQQTPLTHFPSLRVWRLFARRMCQKPFPFSVVEAVSCRLFVVCVCVGNSVLVSVWVCGMRRERVPWLMSRLCWVIIDNNWMIDARLHPMRLRPFSFLSVSASRPISYFI